MYAMDMPEIFRASDATDFSQESERLYRGLVEISPDAVFINCNDRIVFINPATLKIFGTDDPSQILGKSPLEFVHPDSHDVVRQRIAAIEENCNPLPRIEESWCRVDGTRMEVEVAAVALRWQGEPAVQVVARDVTERKRLENELRRGAESLQIALDAARMGTWHWDVARDASEWNDWHFRLLGLAPGSVTPSYQTMKPYIYPDDLQAVDRALREALQLGLEYRMEHRVLWPDGTVRWVRGQGRIVERDEQGAPLRMSGVITDITEQREAQEELQRAHDEMELRVRERTLELSQLNNKLQQEIAQRRQLEAARRALLRRAVTSQEDERRRISRELHDQLGQNLAALMMGLKNLSAPLDDSPVQLHLNEQLHKLQSLTAVLMEQVHHLAWELRPAALDNIGLEAALRQCVGEWSHNSGVPAEFLARGLCHGERLPWHVETAFYRAVQEALHNVQRHAQARQVSVLLEQSEHNLVAIVEDDGVGIALDSEGAPLDPEKRERLGLVGIRERLEQIGGEVEIESAPGQGMTIFLRAPLDRRNTPREEG
jgi:PAS domain S-box-containing protein